MSKSTVSTHSTSSSHSHASKTLSSDATRGAAFSSAAATKSSLKPTADRVVDKLSKANKKITKLRTARLKNPDTVGDKALRKFVPMAVGAVGAKAFQGIWNKTADKIDEKHDGFSRWRNGLLFSMLFAALAAAFSTFIGHWSHRGSEAWIQHRQEKRAE